MSLPFYHEKYWWYVSKWSGSLIRSPTPPSGGVEVIPDRVQSALVNCENPFRCEWSSLPPSVSINCFDSKRLDLMSRRLFALGNKRFLASVMYSCWNVPLFDNTKLAYAAVSQQAGFKDLPNDRCLQRTLLVAKTSRSFRDHGVLFIGAEFSTGEMHAWIIENGEQPDFDDRMWINYRPLLAMHG